MNRIFRHRLPTLLDDARLANLVKYCKLTESLTGAVCEFGVYKGGSLELITLSNPPDAPVFGLDSFEGLPAPGNEDFHNEADFADVNYNGLVGYFKMLYPNVRIVKGFSPFVFTFFDRDAQFRFVHVDVDLMKSVADAIDFFVPRMVAGGIILFDDYGFNSTLGAKKALDKWGKGIAIEETKQYLYIA